ARNILAMIKGRKPRRFHYWDKGNIATIGRNKAVADLKFIHLRGLPAWMAWLFVHIVFLIGFRNRFLVLFQWAWAYLTYQRSARLITGKPTAALPYGASARQDHHYVAAGISGDQRSGG